MDFDRAWHGAIRPEERLCVFVSAVVPIGNGIISFLLSVFHILLPAAYIYRIAFSSSMSNVVEPSPRQSSGALDPVTRPASLSLSLSPRCAVGVSPGAASFQYRTAVLYEKRAHTIARRDSFSHY